MAAAIARLPATKRNLVAVDGVDGAGKTTFGDRLALAGRDIAAPHLNDRNRPPGPDR